MMNKDMMDINMDGSGMEGTTWWKPDGSDHFTIREVLMSPDGFAVRTTDGRLIEGDVFEKYIQADSPIGDMTHREVPRIDSKQLEGIDSSAIIDKDEPKSLGSLRYSHPGSQFKQPTRQNMVLKDPLNHPLENVTEYRNYEELDAVSFGMIDRVLGNINVDELVSVNINPIEKVDNGMVTLVKTLNIKDSEIKTYMVNRLAEKFESMVDTAFTSYLNNLLGEGETVDTSAE